MGKLNKEDLGKQYSGESNTTHSTSMDAEAHPIAKVVIQKHPYNATVPRSKARTIGSNCQAKKCHSYMIKF